MNLFDIAVNYQLTLRWSLIADVSTMTASRARQSDPLNNVYHSRGIGDVTVGAQDWGLAAVFNREPRGNVAFSASLKLPTGINDAKGVKKLSEQKAWGVMDDCLNVKPARSAWCYIG